MPSRTDLHASHHESSVCADRKAASQSPPYPKYSCDHVTQQRSRRTRLTSGGCMTGASPTALEDCGSFRTRRTSNLQSKNVPTPPRHVKSNFKQTPPTSPNSLLKPLYPKAVSLLDSYVAQRDQTTRMEQLEDDNSFSSSIFSEHMAPPDLPLILDSVTSDSGKSCGDEILSSGHALLTSDGTENDDTKELVRDQLSSDIKTDVAGLLIHEDSRVSTPLLVTTDDPVSSEGEDDNDGKEQSLMQSQGSTRLETKLVTSSNLIPTSESCLLPDSCVTSSIGFNAALTVLSSPSFNHVPTMMSLSSPSVSGGSELRSNSLHLSHAPSSHSIAYEQFTSMYSSTFQPHDHPFACTSRVLTRSQTAELVKQNETTFAPFDATCDSDTGVYDDVLHSDTATTCLSVVPETSCSHNLNSITSSPHCSNHQLLPHKHDNSLVTGCTVHSPRNSNSNESASSSFNQKTLQSRSDRDPCVALPNWDFAIKERMSQLVVSVSNVINPPFQDEATIHTMPQLPTIAHASSTPTSASVLSETSVFESGAVHTCLPYPLRSRLRRECLRREWLANRAAPKSFNHLPTEVLFRITHYLSIQDLFRLQLVSSRCKALVERYLLLVKRINFSNGLPFAFLPDSINDSVLKRILSRTPEVTHILGFYPKTIAGSHPSDCHNLGSTRSAPPSLLTYAGIISAFRLCPKLRSVELMDVELMSKLVHYLPRIKFHGMFRNRPDSWDCEYAVPLPVETNPETVTELVRPKTPTCNSTESVSDTFGLSVQSPTLGGHLSSLFCCVTAIAEIISKNPRYKSRKVLNELSFKRLHGRRLSTRSLLSGGSLVKSFSGSCSLRKATLRAHQWALEYADLASWLDPLGELPIGQGSPSTVPHFLPCRSTSGLLPLLENAFHQTGSNSFWNMIMTPFLQPGLPPIEAELIAAPFTQNSISENAVPGSADNPAFPLMGIAFGALFVSPDLIGQGLGAPFLLASQGAGTRDLSPANQPVGGPPPAARPNGGSPVVPAPPLQPNHLAPVRHMDPHARVRMQSDEPGQANLPAGRRQPSPQYIQHTARPWFASPLPWHSICIGLPNAIANLTKLDLVSVTISAIPRLDNIKYLHLKWVLFASADPFFNFSATKLQSFVMNNCIGPSRVVRFVRIFSALARAPQLTRLELVGIRFVDGLLAHMIDVPLLPGRAFRNLQRLVLSSNKEAAEFDVGLLLLAGQQSLNHVALQVAHTRDSLFQSLLCAQARFPRLENLILGYQDPYQSRLTVSELTCLGIGDSPDHLVPLCSLTDRGLSLVFDLCPRLINLTVRHSPYLTSTTAWRSPTNSCSGFISSHGTEEDPAPASSISRNQQNEALGGEDASSGNPTPSRPISQPMVLLRSLTLENCPGITVESLEETISTGIPFPCLETLVLRDMFMHRSGSRSVLLPKPSYNERVMKRKITSSTSQASFEEPQLDAIDWRKVSYLLALSDLLGVRRLGISPICPEGVGLASSVRELTTATQPPGARAVDMPLKQFDLFYALRIHYYLNSLFELDGSCGPGSVGVNRIRNLLFCQVENPCTSGNSFHSVDSSVDVEFVSQATQTCVCGLLEWHVLQNLSSPCPSTTSSANPPHFQQRTSPVCSGTVTRHPSSSDSRVAPVPASVPTSFSCQLPQSTQTFPSQQRQQLGGPLAYHPYPPSTHHQELYKLITCSDWANQLVRHPAIASLSSNSRVFVESNECLGCASDPLLPCCDSSKISARHFESTLAHQSHTWHARDATVDTAELRCHITSHPLALIVYQPPLSCHTNLTSIHFEKVGISHLVLSGAPHLKNVTLENCPQLQAILFNHSQSMSEGESGVQQHTVPSLRRIRVIRCPKFGIFYLLHAVSALYPAHDENISITYRPFGQYNEQVERALWARAHHAHVLISHDYKQHESERQMEEFHSTFDQLFREVISFADMLMRRELFSPRPKPSVNGSVPSNFRRSEHGVGWSLVTDIPWIHEICCSILRNSETRRSDHADQFYEVLSEIQTAPSSIKLQRRGIHLHVQYRDVHDPFSANSTMNCPVMSSYHNWEYSEQYLMATHPLTDLNAWGDGLDESVVSSLPPLPKVIPCVVSPELAMWQRLLLSQEEADLPIGTSQLAAGTSCPAPSPPGFHHTGLPCTRVLRRRYCHVSDFAGRQGLVTKRPKFERHSSLLHAHSNFKLPTQQFRAPCPGGTRKRTLTTSIHEHNNPVKRPRSHTS